MLKTLIPFFSLALIAQTPAPAPMPPAAPKVHPPVPGQGAEAPEPKDGDVVATLGKRTIQYGDFTRWLKLMAGPRAEMIRKSAANRGQVLKQYLELQVLAAKGRQQNLQNTKEFKATLSVLEQQCYARILMDEDRPGSEGQKLKAKAENPTDAEVLAYFQANADRWAVPEKFTARHLLVALKGAPGAGDKGLTEAEAQAKLAKLQEELKSGKKLADLTKDNSDDPGSKNNGGLYSDIPFGRFAKEFEAAVRTQEIGKVGQPVKTAFGYHLIEVESRSPKQAADFDKVKDAVRKQMIPERREKLNKDFLEQAKKDVGYKDAPGAQAPAAPQS